MIVMPDSRPKFSFWKHNLFFRRGYTLIETLIVALIIITVSGLVITYTRTSEKQISLSLELEKIAGLIFRAKSLSLATLGESGSSIRSCGYGLEIDYDSDSYSIFSYEPPVDVVCSSITDVAPNLRRAIQQAFFLPRGIVFKKGGENMHFVLFVPPEPAVLLGNEPDGSLTAGPVNLYLETEDGSFGKALTVNASGQIDF